MNSIEDKKKKEVQISTIISTIEKELNELIRDSQSRATKTQLISVKEILKILEKRLKNYNDLLLNEEENKKLKDEARESKQAFCKELDSLKQENDNLKHFINGLPERFKVKLGNKDLNVTEKIDSKEESIKTLENKINLLNSQVKDEKTKTYKLNSHVIYLESTITKMTKEFEEVTSNNRMKENFNEDYEKVISVYKRNNNELKQKIDELNKINTELKQRLSDSEVVLNNHTGDFKKLIKENSNYKKKIEEYDKEKNQLVNNLSEKENRLNFIRHMNSKLENKSNKIVKKFEDFKKFEAKSFQVSENCNKLISVIEEMNQKLELLQEEKITLFQELEEKNNELTKLNDNFEKTKSSLKLLEFEKISLSEKNVELERNLKKKLESEALNKKELSFTETKELSNLRNKDQLNSKYFKSMNHSNNIPTTVINNSSSNFLSSNFINTQPTYEMKVEELKPAKLFVNDRKEIEIKNK